MDLHDLTDELAAHIRTIADFPRAGVSFKDLTPLLESPDAYLRLCTALEHKASSFKTSKVVAIESRGFLFAAPTALALKCPLLLARKPGKLPNETFSRRFALEYDQSTIHLQRNSGISEGDRVVILDDLVATGGTALAVADIVHQDFAVPKENILIMSLIDLPTLGGSARFNDAGFEFTALIKL